MRILIVDDEQPARNRLRRLLAECPDIEIAGEAEDGVKALEMIERDRPELVLLDVQMPTLNGFELLAELGTPDVPLVVFVTSYEEYALRAFEVSAVDYLLKPVDSGRLNKALAKARAALDARSNASVALANLERIKAVLAQSPRARLQRVVARKANKLHLLAIDDIQAFISEDELVFALVPAGRFLVNHTLKDLEDKLDPEKFVRVHKQTLVNLGAIAEIDPLLKGGATARLHCGLTIEISRRYAVGLRQKLGW